MWISTENILRPWSQKARQLTPRRGTVAHLGNQGCCVHIHTENLCINNIAYVSAKPDAVRVEARVNPMLIRVSLP